MSLFKWNKDDELSLDKALSQPVPPEPVPEKKYVAFIEMDTEIQRCYGIPGNNVQSVMQSWGQHGAFMVRDKQPVLWIPAHRILKVTFRPQEDVEREDREGRRGPDKDQ